MEHIYFRERLDIILKCSSDLRKCFSFGLTLEVPRRETGGF